MNVAQYYANEMKIRVDRIYPGMYSDVYYKIGEAIQYARTPEARSRLYRTAIILAEHQKRNYAEQLVNRKKSWFEKLFG